MNDSFNDRLKYIATTHEKLIDTQNQVVQSTNGLYERFAHPVITRDHIPLTWRYDFDEKSNPHLLERLGVNAAFNAGAIEYNGKICVVCRIEGDDRKSFFGIAESPSGIDSFRFRGTPLVIEPLDEKETNHYDMRLTAHEDGWIYGLFCVETHDDNYPGDPSAAKAECGVVRTKDLERWERLPNVASESQQRNVVLHPEFVDGKYGLYTRPSDGFIDTGSGNGIGWVLVDSMENAIIRDETIIDQRIYHTVKEVKNGQGAPPLKTPLGWLHIPHGVRGHACGLRYLLYMFITSLDYPSKVIHAPGGLFLSALGEERMGDTTCNVFSNGMVMRKNGEVLIYYGGSDTRLYVVRSTVDRLLDYAVNTPPDGLRSSVCVEQRLNLIRKNKELLENTVHPLLKKLASDTL